MTHDVVIEEVWATVRDAQVTVMVRMRGKWTEIIRMPAEEGRNKIVEGKAIVVMRDKGRKK